MLNQCYRGRVPIHLGKLRGYQGIAELDQGGIERHEVKLIELARGQGTGEREP
jgi:hypothetical protein